MKRLFIILFVLAVVSNIAMAVSISEYNINFDIESDLSVSETINVRFVQSVLASNLSYSFDGDIESVSVTSDNQKINFNLIKEEKKTIISPVENTFIESLSIRFKTKDLVFQLGERSLFFTKFSTLETEKTTIVLSLPEGYGIAENSYSPENGIVTSNGRKIYITWNINNQSDQSITVKFEPLNKGFNIFIPIAIILIVTIFIVYIKLKKRSKEDFMKGFGEDEKKVIENLEKNPIGYQNKIEQEFKFSRSKMTRIIQKLEAKGIIEKKKKGRTNKIIYKK